MGRRLGRRERGASSQERIQLQPLTPVGDIYTECPGETRGVGTKHTPQGGSTAGAKEVGVIPD